MAELGASTGATWRDMLLAEALVKFLENKPMSHVRWEVVETYLFQQTYS